MLFIILFILAGLAVSFAFLQYQKSKTGNRQALIVWYICVPIMVISLIAGLKTTSYKNRQLKKKWVTEYSEEQLIKYKKEKIECKSIKVRKNSEGENYYINYTDDKSVQTDLELTKDEVCIKKSNDSKKYIVKYEVPYEIAHKNDNIWTSFSFMQLGNITFYKIYT